MENKKIANDNLNKLRMMTDQLVADPQTQFEVVLKQLKKIVDEGKEEISSSRSPVSKVKCYEKMCAAITGILNNVNF